MSEPKQYKSAIVRSALWASYGDALGFPTELVSASDFAKKSGGVERAVELIECNRRVGGLFGPTVPFPRGAYSDDTQLRLCTSRAIRSDGYFDVESFAKIELPVWLNYAQGAGRGSKAAAANLALRDTTWSQNFFRQGDVLYWQGGGNGAAMRIQPHVWKSHSDVDDQFMNDVVRDAICTHGHPRGILGAAIHAQFLHVVLQSRALPGPADWADIGQLAAERSFDALVSDEELAFVWIPGWEQLSKSSLENAWHETAAEWAAAAKLASKIVVGDSPMESYKNVLLELGGYSKAERGSGLKTALFSVVAPWLFRQEAPEVALQNIASEFGSDTDTIATMAGALIGCVAPNAPPSSVQDQEYIVTEAERIYAIGENKRPKNFPYPDLLNWHAPKAQSDAFLNIDGRPHLAGLGKLELLGEAYPAKKGNELLWQWGRLDFGQTVLTKRRPSVSKDMHYIGGHIEPSNLAKEVEVFHKKKSQEEVSRVLTIDEATQHCIKENFDATLVGNYLMSFSTGVDGIEKAIAFAAILSKARLARLRRS